MCISIKAVISKFSVFNRYMAIVHPLKPRMKFQTAYWLIFGVWIIPVLIAVPSAYFATEHEYPHSARRHDKKIFCAQIWSADQQLMYRSYFLFIFIVEFLGPVVTMSVCYARISRELWFKNVPGFPTDQLRKRLRGRRRTVVALIAVLVAYVLCWAPYYSFTLLRDFYPALITRGRNSLVVFYIIECIAMSNGVINTLCFVSVRNSGVKCLRAVKLANWRSITRAIVGKMAEDDIRTSSLRVTEDVECTQIK